MTIYRGLLGDDPRTTFLLAVVGKRREDFPSFVSAELEGAKVVVTTGSGLRHFRIPKRWHTDVSRMEDILTNGMSYELEEYIARVLDHD